MRPGIATTRSRTELGLHDKLTGNDADNVLEGGAGNDQLDGGKGINTASYEHATSGVTADLRRDRGRRHYRRLIHRHGHRHFRDTDTLNETDFVVASNRNDILTGDMTDDTFAPGRGTDFVDGGDPPATTTTGITVNMTGEDAGTVTSTDGVNTTFINMEVIADKRFADTFNGGTGTDDFK